MASSSGATLRKPGLVLLLVWLFLGSAWAQETPPSQDPLEVTAAFPRDIPPGYSLDQSGQPQGFARDVMDEVARRANLKVRYWVVGSLAEAVEAVKQGRTQIIPSLAMTPGGVVPLLFADIDLRHRCLCPRRGAGQRPG